MNRERMQALAREIASAHGAEALLDERLAPWLSMRVGGPVAAFLKPADSDSLPGLLAALHAAGLPVRLLGGGSNLVAEDEALDLVVVHLGSIGGSVEWDGARARVAAGTPLAVLLRDSTKRGLTGLEWAAGLPGSVGGAVVGNAGAFGGEMGPSVREVVLVAPDGGLRRHRPDAGDFSYRRSFVREGELVLEVELELAEGEPEAIRAEVARVNAQRSGSQPKGGHSSGCMFKNPEGDAAGRLIDACGLKGRRRGGASVSERHANFLINDGSATAADILGLMDEVRAEVRRATGVELESEVRVWRAREAEVRP